MAAHARKRPCLAAEDGRIVPQGTACNSKRIGDPAVSPNPQRGTPDGDAVLAIRSLARATAGDVQELQTLYVLEAFLARIAASEHRDDFVLKGGVLLAAFALRRPTKDIDLQATGLANEAYDVAERVRAIASIDIADGVVFDAASVTATAIRDEDEYAGVRVRLVGHLGRSRVTIGIDVNFGDPIWPAPTVVEVPRLLQLGQTDIRLLGYPLTMVLAEKIITMLDRGEANTRWRDFADVYTLTRSRDVDASELRASFETVARHRGVELGPIRPALAEMPPLAQAKWAAWRKRTGRLDDLPEAFDHVLDAVSEFADPVLGSQRVRDWDPVARRWG
ncbi:nucleotidyl transferase AbiEii/AbiGii toxin family protein [Demequina capsici]|uniref:Nucleotidyl transferase AbiEii/AbiGii toxin family protein n=1 Tax=Demequina capsici TaxID=3075620 RepID=A0AA96J9I8_9MICO|nr:nucleotidyl transferase AbiEii/AbiGii toxin family protein [Demequina sp. PMTSA13]WNM26445.1 nucleotidyl transferase AbiEii/AbiGii toxin family protein [Demequina sp. PMTSA13]